MDAETTIYSPLVSEIAKAREHLQNSLEKIDEVDLNPGAKTELLTRILFLENDNKILKSTISELSHLYREVTTRLEVLEQKIKLSNGKETSNKDDQFDIFSSESDEEIAEKAWIREQRLAEYSAKKSRKPTILAKSSLILDVKPWDDETNLEVMEKEIRKIFLDGLLWGASKFVPVAFGIQKLSISCVVEDEKVSIDWLAEEIEKLEDFVQSVDVAAFNKI
ncbi:uncharacterized protein Dwil_GK24092 [Drosophila willistoni]|uniref:Translation elongation factor EF1B beta/delta subunit guanine nucleotide exchange domain-containing protein n=2 Tax=Drosophila willistoni TaxID=7260 RepID=A0A0Q9X3S4_DROWI|nr:uncharacterized protein Dwil_GK24092 [Drosophila willistoni]